MVTEESDAQLFMHLQDISRLYSRDWTMPGFQALVVYRLARWRQTLPRTPIFRVVRAILYVATRAGLVLVRNFYGIELHDTMRAGRRLKISHQNGIVLHWNATFGEDCSILQGVTLGQPNRFESDSGPVIGDRVLFGAGAVVLGGVKIGNDAKIGPNSVVTTDVPAGATVFGNPARVMPGPKPDAAPAS